MTCFLEEVWDAKETTVTGILFSDKRILRNAKGGRLKCKGMN